MGGSLRRRGCSACAVAACECARRACPPAGPPLDPPLPAAPPAARPRRSLTATQRVMTDFTAGDMRKDFSSDCRRKSGGSASSCAALAQLDPRRDGDIRKFVVRVATRSRLPTEVIEPFVENNHRLPRFAPTSLSSVLSLAMPHPLLLVCSCCPSRCFSWRRICSGPQFQRRGSQIGGPSLATSGVTSTRRRFHQSLTLVLSRGPRTSSCSRRPSQPRTWRKHP